jgi:hypothetical protein
MKVALLSDIHENYHNLLKALDAMRERGVERILCLGDRIALVLAKSGIPVFCVWGNNDGDKHDIVTVAASAGSGLTMGAQTYAFVEIEARKLFLTHYPDLAGPMARLQEFDAVFYGHDHIKRQEQVGLCLLVNPGEISAHKTGQATFAIYDTETNGVDFFAVPDALSLRTDYVVEHVSWIALNRPD